MILGDVIEHMCLSSDVGITLIEDELNDMEGETILASVNSTFDIDDEFYMNYEVTFTTLENNNIIFYVRKVLTT